MSLSDLTQLDWRNPWWLLLALQPVFVALWARRTRQRTLHYADAHLRPWALRGALRTSPWSWSGAFAAVAWLLLACAAAGPRLPLVATTPEGGAARVHDIDIIVVLDVSPSMQATDVSPRRLQRAQLELNDLQRRLHGEHIGLIAFSGAAGLLTPPTDDYTAFAHYLALADPALFKTPGTNLAAALGLARDVIAQRAPRIGAVLLLTDGEADAFSGAAGVAAQHAAASLKARGVPLSVLVVATAEGAPLLVTTPAGPGGQAGTVTSRPDATALRELAALGGGQLAFVRDGDADWRALYDDGLYTLPGAAQAPERVAAWRELYPLLLAPALLLFVFTLWPRRTVAPPLLACVAIAIVGGGLFSPAVVAAEADAYAAYRNGDYALAQLLYRDQHGYAARMGEGAAAYRRARYTEAVEQFSVALLNAASTAQRAAALFNLGNGYFRLSNYAAAADSYGGSLELSADNADARANLERALARLRALSAAERSAAGAPRRRGQALGETPLGANDNGAPIDFDTPREPLGALRPRAGITGAERAKTATGAASDARATQLNAERDYRAALKKLELVNDRPADMLKELIRLETSHDPLPATELPPW